MPVDKNEFVRLKRELLDSRRRTAVLEDIRTSEFKRRLIQERQPDETYPIVITKRGCEVIDPKRQSHYFRSDERRAGPFEANYLGWMPNTHAAEGQPGPGAHHPKAPEWVQRTGQSCSGSSSFASTTKPPPVKHSYFNPRAPRPADLKEIGGALDKAARVTIFDRGPSESNTLRQSAGMIIVPQDDWGPFSGAPALLKAHEKELSPKKSTVLLARAIRDLGVKLSDHSVWRLFETLRERREAKEYELRLIYGDMFHSNEKSFPESCLTSWSRLAPGEHYNAASDVRTIEGALAANARKPQKTSTFRSETNRVAPQEWVGDQCRVPKKRPAAAARQPAKTLRDSSTMRTKGMAGARRTHGASGTSPLRQRGSWGTKQQRVPAIEKEPWFYEMPDELRGRDVADLRLQLKHIWTEEYEKGVKEAEQYARTHKDDSITATLSGSQLLEWNSMKQRNRTV